MTMKTYEKGGVFEHKHCKQCSYRAMGQDSCWCSLYQLPLGIANKFILINCPEPWKDAMWRTLTMLRSFKQEPVDVSSYEFDRDNDRPQTIANTVTIDTVTALTTEIAGMGVLSKEEIEKFMGEVK